MDASVIGWFAQLASVGAVLALYHYIDGRNRATSKEVEALRRDHDVRLNNLERATERVVTELQHLPRASDVQTLTVQVAKLEGALNGNLQGMRAQMTSIHSRTERIEDYLERDRS